MTTYCVECFWPGVSEIELAGVLERFDEEDVRRLDTILVPADEIVLCVVDAPGKTDALAAAERSGLPWGRIVECVRVASRADSPLGARRGEPQ